MAITAGSSLENSFVPRTALVMGSDEARAKKNKREIITNVRMGELSHLKTYVPFKQAKGFRTLKGSFYCIEKKGTQKGKVNTQV